jgi:hypothetical protein
LNGVWTSHDCVSMVLPIPFKLDRPQATHEFSFKHATPDEPIVIAGDCLLWAWYENSTMRPSTRFLAAVSHGRPSKLKKPAISLDHVSYEASRASNRYINMAEANMEYSSSKGAAFWHSGARSCEHWIVRVPSFHVLISPLSAGWLTHKSTQKFLRLLHALSYMTMLDRSSNGTGRWQIWWVHGFMRDPEILATHTDWFIRSHTFGICFRYEFSWTSVGIIQYADLWYRPGNRNLRPWDGTSMSKLLHDPCGKSFHLVPLRDPCGKSFHLVPLRESLYIDIDEVHLFELLSRSFKSPKLFLPVEYRRQAQ